MGDNNNNNNNNYDTATDDVVSDVVDADSDSSFIGIDPLQFSVILFGLLVLFVFYLLLPRGIRKQYFGAYPKRHAWSARNSRSSRGGSLGAGSSVLGASATTFTTGGTGGPHQLVQPMLGLIPAPANNEQTIDFSSNNNIANATTPNDQEQIVISAAMQQLREPGVLIVAHGSRGKPKTVRLQLTESSITWRTETRKSSGGNNKQQLKLGKLHSVPLQHIMYVDVGKQTTALRRVENAAVPEQLCFSLLTKEGSLDLQAASIRERDALVHCFSLVLDEVHAHWRDIYRGPSSDMPSSFDEVEQQQQQQQQRNNNNNNLPSA